MPQPPSSSFPLPAIKKTKDKQEAKKEKLARALRRNLRRRKAAQTGKP